MPIDESEWSALREDVGYIKAKIEAVADHEQRIRAIEKRWWQFPVAIVAPVIGHMLGLPHVPVDGGS